MSTITFEFDQREINQLIAAGEGSENMVISILSAKERPGSKSNIFLAAQLSDPLTNAPVKSAKVPVGCPVPPGWQVVTPGITHSQLENLPKFIISASEKNKLLTTGSTGNQGELLVNFEAPETASDQLTLSFKTKGANVKIIPPVVGLVS